MKRFFASTVLILLTTTFISGLRAQENMRVVSSTYDDIHIAFSAGELEHGVAQYGGDVFSKLTFGGALPSQTVGCPELPVFSQLIEVPMVMGAVHVEVSHLVADTLNLADIGVRGLVFPAQPSRSKSDTSATTITLNDSVYGADAFFSLFGDEPCCVQPMGVARDRRLALLQVAPLRYNAVRGTVVIYKSMDIRIWFDNVDKDESEHLYEVHHTPFFGGEIATLNSIPHKEVSVSAPVRYLVVSHSSFAGQLDSLLAWKRRKGFIADIVYTNNPLVGSTTASISSYLQSLYMGATIENPAPTYVLLVGDVEQIPAFSGTTSSDHVSDLYYYTWTSGDHIPDCYFGRFSAQNIAQLTPQVEKTLMYERYTFADPSFLDKAVLVAGVDGGNSGDYGYTHADPAMDYAAIHYVNGSRGFSQVRYFKNNTSIDPNAMNVTVGPNASSNSATVRGYYNQGAGWINYSAHGSATSWGTPNFTTSHVSSMTNVQKFGVMIGNCCLTQKFETATCLGEALLRKDNYSGAVGYIGGTNSTYWSEDFYWAVGLRSGIGPTMSMAYDAQHLGVYDRLCHTHNEAYVNHYFTTGAMVMAGNMAVESSTSGLKHYYWEIYMLMGDPSVMPWLTQADTMNLTVPSAILAGSFEPISVHAVPHAYVAVKDAMGALIGTSFADAQGDATITPGQAWQIGTYEVAATAQQYRTSFRNIPVVAPDGPFVAVSAVQESASLNVGDTVLIVAEISNLGSVQADSIHLTLSVDGIAVQLLDSVVVCGPLNQGTSLSAMQPFRLKVKEDTEDLTRINFTITATWDSCAYSSQYRFAREIMAPRIEVEWTLMSGPMAPGQSGSLLFRLHNKGHMALPTSSLTISQPFAGAVELSVPTTMLSIPINGVFERTYTLLTSADIPEGLALPVTTSVSSSIYHLHDCSNIYLGTLAYEDFDGIVSIPSDWDNDVSSPWSLSSDEAHSGLHSLKSGTITHSQTSSISIEWTSSKNDSISFWHKVSSENNYDWLTFYIDGTQMERWSGSTGSWEYSAYAVEQGTHTFQFVYSKDGSVSSGSDCAWIDDLSLPLRASTLEVLLDTVCPGSEYVFRGSVINTTEPGSGYVVEQVDPFRYQYIGYMIAPIHQLDTMAVSTCDSYDWYGRQYTVSGLYVQPWTDSYGCDSSSYLLLSLHYRSKDTIVVNATNSYVFAGQTLTESGRYQHTFTSVDGCDSVVVLILEVEHSGIDEVGAASMTIYPNPAHGQVRLLCDVPICEVYVYDMYGKAVLRQTVNNDVLNIKDLPAGSYAVKAIDANRQIHVVKLVVK